MVLQNNNKWKKSSKELQKKMTSTPLKVSSLAKEQVKLRMANREQTQEMDLAGKGLNQKLPIMSTTFAGEA